MRPTPAPRMIASLSTAVPLAYVLQSGFDTLEVKKVESRYRILRRQKAVSDRQRFRQPPRSARRRQGGTDHELLVGENGAEAGAHRRLPGSRKALTPGPLYFTVADGMTTNLTEFRQIIGAQPKSVAQLISTVNSLRPNTKAYVRVWRPEARLSIGRRRFAGSSAVGGHDPGRLPDGPRQHHPDPQFQDGRNGNRRGRQRHHRIQNYPG